MSTPAKKARALYDARATRTPILPFTDAEPEHPVLRQIILATHSSELVDELLAAISERGDTPLHEMPEILFAQIAMRDDPWEPGATPATRFARIRPSQQLELILDSGADDSSSYTLAEVEESLRGANSRRV